MAFLDDLAAIRLVVQHDHLVIRDSYANRRLLALLSCAFSENSSRSGGELRLVVFCCCNLYLRWAGCLATKAFEVGDSLIEQMSSISL